MKSLAQRGFPLGGTYKKRRKHYNLASGSDPIYTAYIKRVGNDGGIIEAKSCLYKAITNLKK